MRHRKLVRKLPLTGRSLSTPTGFTMEVGPETPEGYVRHLEVSAAGLRPDISSLTQAPPTWVTYVGRPLMRFLFGHQRRQDPRYERELALRVASMTAQGVPEGVAWEQARAATVLLYNDVGYQRRHPGEFV